MLNSLTDTPFITTLFESSEGDGVCHQYYRDVLIDTLKKILPPDFFYPQEDLERTYQHQKNVLQKSIPLITCSDIKNLPGTLSFFALSKYRLNSFKFFFEMISRWLTPGRSLNVVLVYATDFRVTHYSGEVYTICEVMISIVDREELEEIQRNFPIIGTEIALGIHSEFYAQRIMEIKGLSADEKTASILGFISYLFKRFPKYYDSDVFTEMQHVLVTCRDDFKFKRQARHLSRMIGIQYLFRKGLRESLKKNPQSRYLHVKIFRASIQHLEQPKKVLCILVGLNLIRDHENFSERNFIKAVQHYIPSVAPLEGSFFIHKLGSENICISYIEVEKKDGNLFTSAEIRKLRRDLPGNLKNRIERHLNTIFMPRNEEEIMRNILVLTNQIKYVRDIPQVFITFDEQVYTHLYFTVILARLLKPNSSSIADLFRGRNVFGEYVLDRTKIMGHVRNKYPKEATVFRLKLPKEGFLRSDHSIDLYKARQTIVRELMNILGEIRDYNGGMISKQHELLSHIRELLTEVKEYDELLLENFFYSLSPMIVRALVDPHTFKTLFLMLLEGLKEFKSDGYYLKFHTEGLNYFSLIIIEDSLFQDYLNRKIQELHIPSTELAQASVKIHGFTCLGYICSAHDLQKRDHFLQIMSQSLQSWKTS